VKDTPELIKLRAIVGVPIMLGIQVVYAIMHPGELA
jgi:hypothetical protein